jgi:hypothetical protein
MDNIFSDTPLNGAVAWVTLVYILFVAVVPWLGGRHNGPQGVLVRTAAAVLVLGLLCALVVLQCNVGYCGHGAMVLPALLALAGIAGVVTIFSAALALYQWRK